MYVGKMFIDDNSYSMHKNFDDVLNFPLDESDLMVVGAPKSGTNWAQIMMANLWDDWSTTRNEFKRVPNMAGRDRDDYQGYYASVQAGPGRLMKAHMHREAMPYAWPKYGKVINVTRDPRDVCVSHFFMLQTNAGVHPDDPDSESDWDRWVERFLDGRITCGSYLDMVVGWHQYEHPNLMKVYYEDVKADPVKFLREAAEFLGKPVSEDRIAQVAEDTQSRNMKKNPALRSQINVPDGLDTDDRPFIRTGRAGGWPEHFSPEQLEAIIERVMKPMVAAGIDRYAF